MAVTPEELDFATLVSLAGGIAASHLLRRTRADGHPSIRAPHGYVFQQLVEGEPTVGELAASLGMSQQAASKYVAELEHLGYVARRTDATDSRARRIALTAAGAAVIESGRRTRSELDAELAAELGPETLAAARAALTALLERTGGLEAIARRGVPLPD